MYFSNYVLCHHKVIDQFLLHVEKWVSILYGSDPKNNGNFGRIVGDRQMQRLIQLLNSHGGKVICGGDYQQNERFIQPTVIKLTDFKSPAMEEETFGPILLVLPVQNMDEAIHYVNSKPKPLSSYIFSNSKQVQEKIVYNTSSGGVTINATLFHVAHPGMPFGGVGASGTGAYHGKQTFETFSHRKPVLRKSLWMDGGLLSDPFFVYPPWSDMKMSIVRNLMRFV